MSEFEIAPTRQAAFSADGKPIGMFPKNQAKTMCVDVGMVYSPPIHSESNKRSASVESGDSNADGSYISSSASESSIGSATGQQDDEHGRMASENAINENETLDFEDENMFANSNELMSKIYFENINFSL